MKAFRTKSTTDRKGQRMLKFFQHFARALDALPETERTRIIMALHALYVPAELDE